jgi:hypothetical protein
LNPVGLWTLHFDWGPIGNYHWIPLYFNFDGTFAYLAGANEGTWSQVDDNIIWRFKRLPESENNTIYSGICTRNFMSGTMLSFEGERGHWFAVKKGTKVYSLTDKVTIPYLVERDTKIKLDPIGQKIE